MRQLFLASSDVFEGVRAFELMTFFDQSERNSLGLGRSLSRSVLPSNPARKLSIKTWRARRGPSRWLKALDVGSLA